MLYEAQTLFNIVLGVAAFLGGWVLNNIWTSVRDLQTADAQLARQVASIEVLVAGQYVRRDEFMALRMELLASFDKVLEKLDGKVDRHG